MSEVLTELHDELGKQLLSILKEGVPVVNETTGEIVKSPPSPAYLNIMRQLLKDCNIQGTTDSPAIKGIVEGLPDFSGESAFLPDSMH